jgi:hypothetical protein
LSRRRNKIVGRRHPDDRESKPEVTLEDTAVTRAELEVLNRRMTRKSA